MDNVESVKFLDNSETVAGAVDSRILPSLLERVPSTRAQDWEDEVEEESSDDDRNHKHRRRVSRSRSTDRTVESNVSADYGDVSNGLRRDATDHRRVGQFDRERPLKFERRTGCDAGGRLSSGHLAEGVVSRGGGPPCRGNSRNRRLDGVRMGRGREAGNWVDPRPPLCGDAPPLLTPTVAFFPNGRGLGGRGAGWPGAIGHRGVMGCTGALELAHSGQGPPGVMNLGMGMGVGPVRPRCLDFEERGFCLRGDLCPMDHGSHIVVEDVQSLSKFNLPVNLPNGRGLVTAPGQMRISNTILPTGALSRSRGSRGSREIIMPSSEVTMMSNGQASGAEPDLYDPDQPLWNNDRPGTMGKVKKLSSFQMEHPEVEYEEVKSKKDPDGQGTDGDIRGPTGSGLNAIDAGFTVWDRIGPVDVSAAKLVVKLEEQRAHGRGVSWQSERWGEREPDGGTCIMSANPGQVRGTAGWANVDPPTYHPKEGTNVGLRTPTRCVERAQCTLYVNCIPINSNRAEVLLMHFEKLGRVVDVRIPPHSDRAFVQFATREEAESALASPDAVMRNRFIRLSWANRDSITSDHGASSFSAGYSPTTGSEATGGRPTKVGRAVVSAGMNGGCASIPGASITEAINNSSSDPVSFSPTPAVMATKKQEELELMRKKIRQKQEALAQKRDDFRRKLNKLVSQGVTGSDQYIRNQDNKRQRVIISGDSSARVSRDVTAASVLPANSGLLKSSSGEDALAGVVKATLTLTRSSSGVSTGPPTWGRGPARFKLDNRTTTFRVLPPFPATDPDVASAIKDHFAVFGELSSVEVEDVEHYKSDLGLSLNLNSPVRVSYTTRRSAERAMARGRWFRGHSLNLVWVSISSANESPESSNFANRIHVPEDETSIRGDAMAVPEEFCVGDQYRVDKKSNITEEASQSPAREL